MSDDRVAVERAVLNYGEAFYPGLFSAP